VPTLKIGFNDEGRDFFNPPPSLAIRNSRDQSGGAKVIVPNRGGDVNCTYKQLLKIYNLANKFKFKIF